MYPIPFGEDEAFHLRIPTAGLVAEVDSGLEKLFETYFRHFSRVRGADLRPGQDAESAQPTP